MNRFTGTPSSGTRGSPIDICFENPDLAGQTVTITITDGDTTTVDIELDLSGKGTASWTIPASWTDCVVLQHDTSEDYLVTLDDAAP